MHCMSHFSYNVSPNESSFGKSYFFALSYHKVVIELELVRKEHVLSTNSIAGKAFFLEACRFHYDIYGWVRGNLQGMVFWWNAKASSTLHMVLHNC